MESARVRRIGLAGRLRGSAVLAESAGETRVSFRLRGLREGMTLFYASRGRVFRTKVEGAEMRLGAEDICALVLAEGGRLVSGGFTGECQRDRLLDEIRIRAAEEGRAPAAEKKAEPEQARKEKPAPRASVTEDIIDRAKMLFSALGAKEEKPAKMEPKEETKVKNPFPRTFPGSVWHTRPGDHRLFGEQTRDGVKRELIAVPVDLRSGRAAQSPLRTVTGSDGRRYLVETVR